MTRLAKGNKLLNTNIPISVDINTYLVAQVQIFLKINESLSLTDTFENDNNH